MSDQEYSYENELLEEAYRPPMWVTLVFVVTMLAIYFMGRSLSTFYDIPMLPQPSELVR